LIGLATPIPSCTAQADGFPGFGCLSHNPAIWRGLRLPQGFQRPARGVLLKFSDAKKRPATITPAAGPVSPPSSAATRKLSRAMVGPLI
jgi:hypothetical protein